MLGGIDQAVPHMTEQQQTTVTLVDLLREARRSEKAANSLTAAQIEAAYDRQKGPYRKRPFFVVHGETKREESLSNRKEEWLAKRLFNDARTLSLPNDDCLQLLDYQFPLKATRSDEGVGKIDSLA
jgi:hypothetical protein